MTYDSETINPFKAPETQNLSVLNPEKSKYVQARRHTRLFAFLIDALVIGLLSGVLGFFGLAVSSPEVAVATEPGQFWTQILGMAVFNWSYVIPVLVGQLLYFIVNGYLLLHYGQTWGKRLMKIRIVGCDREFPGFIRIYVLRHLLAAVLGQFFLLGVADALAIFTKDRRCLHDYLGNTMVVEVALPVSQKSSVPEGTEQDSIS